MPSGPRLSAPHVLVVDSDLMARTAVASMLAAEGARVTTADCAAEALRQVTARRFDAVVVDAELPGVGGVVAVVQIRGVGNGRDLPALLLHRPASAAERERAAARVSSLPGVAFLERPASGAALRSAINSLTADARLHD